MNNAFWLAGPNSVWKAPGSESAGFLAGFWHGLVLPIAFIVSLFEPRIRIYEANNRGRWYDFGFVIGASAQITFGAAPVW